MRLQRRQTHAARRTSLSNRMNTRANTSSGSRSKKLETGTAFQRVCIKLPLNMIESSPTPPSVSMLSSSSLLLLVWLLFTDMLLELLTPLLRSKASSTTTGKPSGSWASAIAHCFWKLRYVSTSISTSFLLIFDVEVLCAQEPCIGRVKNFRSTFNAMRSCLRYCLQRRLAPARLFSSTKLIGFGKKSSAPIRKLLTTVSRST
mmetsp:Transcript_6447/g.10014  ORF Transcript_6447/g.10014 Transcript_6447/m.10014 type:complete len:203 (-) Transcript_6447:257-865(-)